MKNLIHSGNYESYYLDYMEGMLSEEESMALEAFLIENPTLRVDNLMPEVEPVRVTYSGLEKSLLQTHDTSDFDKNLDYFAIAYTENLLTGEEKSAFKSYLIANKTAKQTVNAYLNTKLDAETVSFSDKERLKRKEFALIPMWKWSVSMAGTAAAIALLVFQYTATQTNTTSVLTASRTNPKEKTITDSSQSFKSTPTKLSEENQFTVFTASPTSANKDLTPQPTIAGEAHNSGKTSPTLLPEVSQPTSTLTASLTEENNPSKDKDFAYVATAKSDDSQTSKSSNASTKLVETTAPTTPKTEEKKGFFIKIGSFFEVSSKKAK